MRVPQSDNRVQGLFEGFNRAMVTDVTCKGMISRDQECCGMIDQAKHEGRCWSVQCYQNSE